MIEQTTKALKIGIPKERRDEERRAAASPETVKRYKGMGLEPVVEAGAGAGTAVADQAYADDRPQGAATVTVGGVKRTGARNLPGRIAPATTVLYAKNLMNFVQLLVDANSRELKIDTGDDLIKGTLLTMGGAVVHDACKPAA